MNRHEQRRQAGNGKAKQVRGQTLQAIGVSKADNWNEIRA
jgi:hypothetical protein